MNMCWGVSKVGGTLRGRGRGWAPCGKGLGRSSEPFVWVGSEEKPQNSTGLKQKRSQECCAEPMSQSVPIISQQLVCVGRDEPHRG
jgi:hypothetical protein